MLIWLNLLIPVRKRKRRYLPLFFNGLKKSRMMPRISFCSSGELLVSSRGESYSSISTTTCCPVCSYARRIIPSNLVLKVSSSSPRPYIPSHSASCLLIVEHNALAFRYLLPLKSRCNTGYTDQSCSNRSMASPRNKSFLPRK